MVTKEDVDKAKAAAVEADAAADTAVKASYGAWDKYKKLKQELKMVTKEDVDKAKADAAAAEDEAWDKYVQLKREYENGNKSTED